MTEGNSLIKAETNVYPGELSLNLKAHLEKRVIKIESKFFYDSNGYSAYLKNKIYIIYKGGV